MFRGWAGTLPQETICRNDVDLAMNRDIVILTKSRKNNEYCVAGLDIETGEWIRLVTDETGAPLLSVHTEYKNVQGFCEPLNVVRVEILRRVAHKNHTEDCHINTQTLTKRGVMTLAAEITGGLTYSAGLGSGYLVVSMATKPYRSKRLYYKFIAKIFPS